MSQQWVYAAKGGIPTYSCGNFTVEHEEFENGIEWWSIKHNGHLVKYCNEGVDKALSQAEEFAQRVTQACDPFY